MTEFVPDEKSILSIAYQKFEAQFEKLETISPEDWTIKHSLVYICKKYKEKFGIRFVLSYQGTPSTSPEYKLCARMWMMLGAKKGDGLLVKRYIDWFYSQYKSSKKFVSMGALARNNLIVKFLSGNSSKEQQIKLSNQELPGAVRFILQQYEDLLFVRTYKDLAFLKKSIDDSSPEEHKLVLDKISEIGFDLSKLDKVF